MKTSLLRSYRLLLQGIAFMGLALISSCGSSPSSESSETSSIIDAVLNLPVTVRVQFSGLVITEDTALSQINQEQKKLTSLRKQIWIMLPKGNGNVTFRNGGSNKCLGIVNGITPKTVACNSNNTVFNILPQGDGSSFIRPVQNGVVLGNCLRLGGPIAQPGPFFEVGSCLNEPFARFFFDKVL